MKKIISLLIILATLFSMSISFAGGDVNVSEDQLKELLSKYDMELLTQEEVSDLRLIEKGNGLDKNLNYKQLDRALAKLKKESSRKSISQHEMKVDNKFNQVESTEFMIMSITDYGTGTEEVTETLNDTHDTGLTDLIFELSVAVNYTYDYEYYPGEPLITDNYRIKSYDSEGTVTDMYSGGYSRLTTYSSNVAKISDTTLKQSFSYEYKKYIPYGINWICIGTYDSSGTHTFSID